MRHSFLMPCHKRNGRDIFKSVGQHAASINAHKVWMIFIFPLLGASQVHYIKSLF